MVRFDSWRAVGLGNYCNFHSADKYESDLLLERESIRPRKAERAESDAAESLPVRVLESYCDLRGVAVARHAPKVR